VIARAISFAVALVGLIVVSPVLALIWLAVLITLGRPVLFTQTRPGLGTRPFTVYKFRTMTASDGLSDVDAVATDSTRLTPLGRTLRATSLDELPQLFNVLKGDMNLVGPRPLLTEYLTRYSAHHARRHEVRPGITGLSQVNGRNALSWEERLDLDVTYVDSRSLALDLRILIKTVWVALSRKGVAAEGVDTMQPYIGREDDAHRSGASDGSRRDEVVSEEEQ
jgi:lipopolysaccharide/colanic/teichoic acid biosynthesis glycosyltransferase